MKSKTKPWLHGVTWISLLTIIPAQAWAGGWAGGASCESTCNAYHKGTVKNQGTAASATDPMSYAYAIDQCGAIPGGKAQNGDAAADPSFASGDYQWDQCYRDLNTTWMTLGQHCSAIAINDAGQTPATVAAAFYTAAGVACTTACIVENIPIANVTAGIALKGVCIGTEIGSLAADIAAMITIQKQGSEMLAGMGSVAGFVGTGVSIAGLIAGKAAGKATASKVSSCVAAALMIAAASMKWVTAKQMGDNSDKECDSIQKFASDAAGSSSNSNSSLDPRGNNAQNKTTGSGGSQGSKGGSRAYQRFVDSGASAHFADGQFAAATDQGPYGKLFAALPKDKLQDALQQASGMSLDQIARELQTKSPASLVASLAGMPTELSDAMKQVEQDALAGKMSPTQTSASFAPAAGQQKTTAALDKSLFDFAFNAPEKSVAANSQETTFANTERSLASGSDIWHEGYKGSIFQIVSGKFTQGMERVEKLEWETPLNRALLGLPAKKPANDGSIKK